jgi:hypothetical protein
MFSKKDKIEKLKKKILDLKSEIVILYKSNKDDISTMKDIKKKDKKLKKLEEEYKKMTKLEIKDGKLRPVSNDSTEEVSQPTPEELEEKRQVREVEMEAIEKREVDTMLNKFKEEPEEQVNELTEEEKNRIIMEEQAKRQALQEQRAIEEKLRADALIKQQYEERIRQEQEAFRNHQEVPQEVPKEVPQEEPDKEPQQEAQQQPLGYKVRLTIFPSSPVTVAVPKEHLSDFLSNVTKAINENSVMVLGENSVVNGRYIIGYDII